MRKYFYRLRLKDWIAIILMIVITYLWINYDQIFFENTDIRMIAFIVLGLILMTGLYFIINPSKIVPLSNTLTLILIPLFIILSIVIHEFIVKDGFQKKSILLWIITTGLIYFSGLLYKVVFKRRN